MSDWFRVAANAPDEDIPIVYCLAHAGGNPLRFLEWQPLISEAGVVAVVPPRRFSDLNELCSEIATAITDRGSESPFILFGHSFGALLAYEVARLLGDRPAHLVVSGCAAPRLLPTDRVVQAARLEGREFAEAVSFFGGMPPEVVVDEDLQEILLPAVQADFQLVADYHHHPNVPLQCGLTLINGADDAHVRPDEVELWGSDCNVEPDFHWVPGGHFYFEDSPESVTKVLRPLVRACADTSRMEII